MTTTHQFSTIAIADILDALVDAVDTARTSTAPGAWRRAIDAAYDFLLQQETIAYDVAAFAIRVESASEAGRFYEANGDCQCRAFTHGAGVCWHRAAARLVRRALELRDIAGEILATCEAEGEPIAPEHARHGAKLEHAVVMAVARRWDEESDRQRLALVQRISAARAAQAEVDELYPPRAA